MKTEDVFKQLGFTSYISELSPDTASYKFLLGEHLVTATQGINRYFQNVFHLSGVLADKRTIKDVSFELPLEVDSFEQGVALVVYAIGDDFEGAQDIPWIALGIQWRDQLPWKKRNSAYEKRPKCQVERDWARLAFRKLRKLSEESDESAECAFMFDGEVLKIKADSQTLTIPAVGEAWDKVYSTKTKSMEFLPQRIMSDVFEISVWEDRLLIDRRAFTIS